MVDNISTLTGLITSKSFLDVPKSINYHLTLQRYKINAESCKHFCKKNCLLG